MLHIVVLHCLDNWGTKKLYDCMFNVYTLAAYYCNVENVNCIISSVVYDTRDVMTIKSLNPGGMNENLCD